MAGLLAIWACSELDAPRALSANPEPAGGPTLSILTYNVNYERLDAATVEAVRQAGADLVFLQEVTPAWQRALAELAYSHREFRFHGVDGGMAVLSRSPFETVEWRPSPVAKFPAWCLRAETPLGRMDVLAVHLHPPVDENGLFTGFFTTGDEREAEIRDHLSCFGRDTDLAVGDFNEGEGSAIGRVTALGMVDVASRFPPVRRTWEMIVGSTVLEGRPDHVFARAPLVPTRVEVLELGGSDHRPLRVTLQLAAP